MLASHAVRTTRKPASPDETESTRLRLTFLTLLVVSLFVLLFSRLWFLQIMAGERFAELAEGNAVRTVSIEAPRGNILDRDGRVLVTNKYVYVVSVQVSEMGPRKDRVLSNLAELLDTTKAELEQAIATSTVSPVRPKPVATNVPEELVFYLWENQSTKYPGVYAELLPRRQYPHGQLAAHVLGYLGEISAEELATERYADYRQGDQVGWSGVEKSHEEQLRGVEGARNYEVNASGEVLRQIDEILPTPGNDLRLTIDLELQRMAEKALLNGLQRARATADSEARSKSGNFEAPAGAVVLLDPDNGAVRAMASWPSFAPERFVGGVSQRYYQSLLNERNDFPLLNRAIQSSYPPGSVFKIVTAAAALRNGFMGLEEELPCPGSWDWNGTVYNNWNPGDSGFMDIRASLVNSCDTVYYELARRMWTKEQETGAKVEYLPAEARRWGFGSELGIDLPSEVSGVVPGRAWRREYWQNAREGYCAQAKVSTDAYAKQLYTELCSPEGAKWRGGDEVNLSIGQGDMQTTPLQIVSAFGAVANGGTIYRPRVASATISQDGLARRFEPGVVSRIGLADERLAAIREGLIGVTASGGTAGGVFGDFAVPVAGKTGTAEMKPKQPFAWFSAFAPVEDPEYVAVAVVEEGGGGSQTAAPIVKELFSGIFGVDAEIGVGEATD